MSVNSFREDEDVLNTDKKRIIKRLLGYLLPHKLFIVIVSVAMLVAVTISLINPLLIEKAIDDYVANGDFEGLYRLAAFAAVINIIYILLVKVRMYVMSLVSNRILMTIRQELYEHIQTLSFAFFDSRPTGKILARIIGDVNSLKDVFVNTVTTLLPGFVTIIGVVIIMLVKNVELGIAGLCTVPFMFVAVFFVQKISHKRWMLFRKKASNMNAYVHEDIAGMNVVAGFNAENETKEIFEELVDEHQKSFAKACQSSDMFGPIIEICWGIGSMIMYGTAIYIMKIDVDSVGLLIAFGTYFNMFWSPIMNLSSFFNQLVTNLSAAERIFDILDTKPDIADTENVVELECVEGSVDFTNVCFTYDKGTAEETKVLDNVSFHVNPGETIALVGPTGAGKTTIVNLISRFYDIESGEIFIDGKNIRNVSIRSLRQQMGVMTQENFIFHGTVKENIMYGKTDATDDEVIAAAKAVNAYDFIMKLEKGFDTELKERGAGLSNGQRQLIAFARTMVSNPRILILDEATSSIDTKTELAVQKGIEKILSGRTSFVIAHRLSTIQNADRIFVIDDGGIKEQGSPKELMEKKGAYYRLRMADSIE